MKRKDIEATYRCKDECEPLHGEWPVDIIVLDAIVLGALVVSAIDYRLDYIDLIQALVGVGILGARYQREQLGDKPDLTSYANALFVRSAVACALLYSIHSMSSGAAGLNP